MPSRALRCMSFLFVFLALGAFPALADPISLAPGQELVINFSIENTNSSDLLWLVSYAPFTVTGTPVFTLTLADGGTTLGSITGGLEPSSPSFAFLFLDSGGLYPSPPPTIAAGYADLAAIRSLNTDLSLTLAITGGTIAGDMLSPSYGALADRQYSVTGFTPPPAGTNIGNIIAGSVSVSPVPEPASLLLLGAGIVAMFAARRKKA
jgi:hypothetical protein